jgi:hypothetical protein
MQQMNIENGMEQQDKQANSVLSIQHLPLSMNLPSSSLSSMTTPPSFAYENIVCVSHRAQQHVKQCNQQQIPIKHLTLTHVIERHGANGKQGNHGMEIYKTNQIVYIYSGEYSLTYDCCLCFLLRLQWY